MMYIAFKFKYIHDNGLLVRLASRITDLSSLEINLARDGDMFFIESHGEQTELEELAGLISSIIPQSLFLLESSVSEIEGFTQKNDDEKKLSSLNIPYCIECQNTITQTLKIPSICSVCGDVEEEFKEDFTALAEELIEKKELDLKTLNGVRRFSLLETKEEQNSSLLICDPSDISKDFLLTQGELNALMMIEKPSVRIKPKVLMHHEHELLKPMYDVFFADDKVTLALSTALAKKGVRAVYCSDRPSLKVATALNENLIIEAGGDMLPWSHSFTNKVPLSCNFNGYHSYVDADGLTLDNSANKKEKKSVEFVDLHNNTKSDNNIPFEPAHGALRSVVLEHDLGAQSLAMIYLSKKNTSQICSYSPKIGYLTMVNFTDNYLESPKAMLDAIESMDDGGKKLIANYKKQFPELFETLLNTKMEVDSKSSTLEKLYGIAAHCIGLTTDTNYKFASEYLEATALEFQGKSGPRIDYKVLKQENGFELDTRLVIRSCISFRLAGVDEYLVSFGFMDSLADFIADQAEVCDANVGLDGAVIGGDLFENHQLIMRAYNALSPNFKVYRNQRLSVDDANVAVGAITLGNEL